jgi:hypothetical protein
MTFGPDHDEDLRRAASCPSRLSVSPPSASLLLWNGVCVEGPDRCGLTSDSGVIVDGFNANEGIFRLPRRSLLTPTAGAALVERGVAPTLGPTGAIEHRSCAVRMARSLTETDRFLVQREVRLWHVERNQRSELIPEQAAHVFRNDEKRQRAAIASFLSVRFFADEFCDATISGVDPSESL